MKKMKNFIVVIVALVVGIPLNAQIEKSVAVDSLTDCQGHVYPVVKIGTQYWMAENLQCTQYDTESEQAGEILSMSRNQVLSPYYTDYSKNSKIFGTSSIKIFKKLTQEQRDSLGLLYNWTAAMGYTKAKLNEAKKNQIDTCVHRQGICPNGWHIPSIEEWTILYDFVMNDNYVKLLKNNLTEKARKKTSDYLIARFVLTTTSGWNVNGFNKYGFSALPAGNAGGYIIEGIGLWSVFWTSSSCGTSDFYRIEINDYGFKGVQAANTYKSQACSVRCVKD